MSHSQYVNEKFVEEAKVRGDGLCITSSPDVVNKYHFDEHDLDGIQRHLDQRHVQMIAIAGTIGTGLFLGSGQAISRAGPLGALIAYLFIGTVAYATMCSVGEMTSFAPVSGSFPHFAARWVDPAFGFATGWNYYFTQAVSIPVQISAAQIILTFWDPNTKHVPIYITVICISMIAANLFAVRLFGESEFFFSIIKLSLITGLIIAGLIIDLGGRFLATIGVLVQAAFSYGGMEVVAIGACEARNPRRNVGRAIRRVFSRVLILYILGILITGMIIPYDDPNLLNPTGSGTAAQSPYVIVMNRAGVKVLPHIINACVFTSAFSAGASAPRVFIRTASNGLPISAVVVSSVFAFLSYLTVGHGANTVFNWFVILSSGGGFFGSLSINATYIGFWRGLRAHGIDRTKFAYFSSLQPYLSIWGTFWLTILILINGFDVFWTPSVSGFLTAYINIPLVILLFVGWKMFKRTHWWTPEEMDFVTGIPTIQETEEEEIPPRNLGEKIAAILF
ncbi:general amino acid permease 1 [Cantharellus anzutake]|uniref:general amino acid permease 1 n=1 Tax=Cantharellus anzutake TaxID=1750568 RepID=UPI0019055670|nr:general amino acid permease 1 [Cantharellus anzutake]KAF8329445.1 general amino acid permease 1 [Cantharellus anzutake]